MDDYLHIKIKIKSKDNLNEIIDMNNRLDNLKEIIKNNSNLKVIFNYNSEIKECDIINSLKNLHIDNPRFYEIERNRDKELFYGMDIEENGNKELSYEMEENINNLSGNIYFFLNNINTCNICYENITVYNFKKIICNHCICNTCYEKWDNACFKENHYSTCPMCRIKI